MVATWAPDGALTIWRIEEYYTSLIICLHFIHTWCFVLIVLNTNIHTPGEISLFSVLHRPHCPGCAFCPYCTTHTVQMSMPPVGFEPTTPASDRLQTLALDRSATGIGRFEPRTLQSVD